MPTGYVSDLYIGKKEVSFRDFVMGCARAFFYDAPEEIPEEFAPSLYHIQRVEELRLKLAGVEAWGEQTATKEAELDYLRQLSVLREDALKVSVRKDRYQVMLDEVREWQPPTAEHEPLKRFMIKQLESSIASDCKIDLVIKRRLSGVEYKQRLLKTVRQDIAYHLKKHQEEVEIAQQRTNYVRDLRKSLASKE